MKTLGLGLIGAGRMGRVHADVLRREVPEGRLVAVADLDASAAGELAESVGARACADHHELLAADDVDAVLIVASTHAHLGLIEDAARARRHVFCEKPIALTVEDTMRAVSLTTDARVRLQVGLYRRFDEDYLRARDRIRSGAIGTPQFIRALQYDTFVPPLAFCDPAVSGGILVDMGIHEFDIAAWLLDDEIVEVHAYGASRSEPRLSEVGDADTCIASVRFRSGALGSVELVRQVGYAEQVRTEIVGTAGSLLVGLLPTSHSALASEGRLALDLPASAFERFRPALAAQLRSFCRAVLDDRDVEPSGAASIPGLAAGIAARRSLELGRPVAL